MKDIKINNNIYENSIYSFIIKIKTLIKVYKSSLRIIKFLNKHLYILSIISLISKFRKTNTYKLVNWIIKIIITLNIIFITGLFTTLVDFETPIDTVYNLYMDLISPYIELIKAKINKILNIIKSVDKINDQSFDMQPFELLNKQYKSNPLPPIDNNLLDATQDDISFNYGDIVFYTSVGFLVYFFLYLPGLNNVPDTEIAQYNWLNQEFIHIKMFAKDVIVNYLFGNTGGGNPPSDPGVGASQSVAGSSDISLSDARTISSGSDVTITQGVISPVDSPSPFNSTHLPRLSEIGITSPNLSPTEFDHYFPLTDTQEASIQTVLTHTNIVNSVIRNLVDTGVQTINTGITNTVNASVQADSPMSKATKILKSIQLLNDNNDID